MQSNTTQNIPTSLGESTDKSKGVKAPKRLTRSERRKYVREVLTGLSIAWQAKNKK